MNYNWDIIGDKLFGILRGRGYRLQMFDKEGNKTMDPHEATRYFATIPSKDPSLKDFSILISLHDEDSSSHLDIKTPNLPNDKDFDTVVNLKKSIENNIGDSEGLSINWYKFDHDIDPREDAINNIQENISSVQSDIEEDLNSQFDLIEWFVEQLAIQHNVDSELIWEDFEHVDDATLLEVATWQKKAGKSKTGGLNKKGVASYRRAHPGSKLQTAVTTKPSKLKKGSKAAKRRKSFCARMSGVKGPMKDENGKPTRKALALRKWNCNESAVFEATVYESKDISKPYGSTKSSYQQIADSKLIIRHTDPIDESKKGSRWRRIRNIFIETKLGERFAYPHAHIAGARAMARHLSNNGRMNDTIGEAILRMSEEYIELKRANKLLSRAGDVDNGLKVKDAIKRLSKDSKRLSGSRGYTKGIEDLSNLSEVDQQAYIDFANDLIEACSCEEDEDAVKALNTAARYIINIPVGTVAQDDDELYNDEDDDEFDIVRLSELAGLTSQE